MNRAQEPQGQRGAEGVALVRPQDRRARTVGADVGDDRIEHFGVEGRTKIGARVALEHERFDEGNDARPCGHPPLLSPSARPERRANGWRPEAAGACMVASGRGE